MISFSSITGNIKAFLRRVSPAVIAAERFLALLLTPEHIQAGFAAVVAVKDKSLTGFGKAEQVATTLEGISDLSPEARGALGAVVGALHMVAKAKGLL